jgi:tRNA-splicing ligase RtcB
MPEEVEGPMNFQFRQPTFAKASDFMWDVSTKFKPGMRVPARIVASKALVDDMDLQVYDQVTNVATLPGIQKFAFCMPDGHSGYGFPIGGVAAMDPETGVISPGGIGFDINCGMRLVTTNLTEADVRPKLKALVDLLFQRVPAGVGSSGFLKPTKAQFREVVEMGSKWCVEQGYGWEEDLEGTEEDGTMKGADANKISERAISRGLTQIGTLGSGNHYLEIQVARPENISDEKTAKAFGIEIPNQIVVMFHCGSRGFGHQAATDYLNTFLKVMEPKYGIKILDRELACAPFSSQEGQDYFSAMKCAINMSFANRQVILHRIREAFEKIFGKSAEDLGMHQVYDVAHNTAKLETHVVDGKPKKVLVHRKGATRALGPGWEEIPPKYRHTGQPVIIGGSMETGSYLLAGTQRPDQETLAFATTAHGSGRTMSRTKAKKLFRGDKLQQDMLKHGIYVKSVSWAGLAEEAGAAYKNIDDVIEATHLAGLSRKVCKFIPIGNVKG